MNKNTGEVETIGLCKDRISILPSVLIENILCRVSLRDAVRTSILSRSWRYNWATIPKLEFIADDMFDKSNVEQHLSNFLILSYNRPPNMSCKAIHQLLLLHLGPILEFTLFKKASNRSSDEIDQILLHLSKKNTLNKLTLHFKDFPSYKVPSFVFSLHHLTELSLNHCEFDLNLAFGRLPSLTRLCLIYVTIYKETFPHPDLNGFSSLTSLSLIKVNIYRETFLHLISTSPLLKLLSLRILWDAEHEASMLDVDFFKLLKFFPLIEHLSVSSTIVKYSAQDVVSREPKTTLLHLKSLCMSDMLFHSKLRLDGLFLLIRSSPNLVKILIQPWRPLEFSMLGISINDTEMKTLGDYSDIWFEHLHLLEIKCFFSSKIELEFVKLILAKSPVLKEVWLRFFGNAEELNRRLKLYRRASPLAEIKVEQF